MTSRKKAKKFGKEEIKHLVFVAGLILIDQIAKYIARTQLKKPFQLIPGILHFNLVKNTGIGFGLLEEKNIILIFITVLIIGLLVYYFKYLSEDKHSNAALCMITAGAVSNLIDRIFLGNIIDFIDFQIWPVFNLADSFITLGIIFLIYSMFKKDKQ